jgi:hypothetical protein
VIQLLRSPAGSRQGGARRSSESSGGGRRGDGGDKGAARDLAVAILALQAADSVVVLG